VVLVGAAVAFGGYSAVAGASMILGGSSGATGPVAAKVELDCSVSRFAWRPECQAEKAQVAAAPDEARRTRRRSSAGTVELDAAPSAAPVTVAALEPAATEPMPAAVEKPKASGPETRAADRGPSQADRAALGDLVRSVANRTPAADRTPTGSSPARQRTAGRNLRLGTGPKSAEPEETGSIRVAKPKKEARERSQAPRPRLAGVARRNAQFASLRTEPVETRRGRRAADGWETAEPTRRAYEDGGWRAPQRPVRLARRTEPRDSYAGMTVTSERIYELPNGRLVSVRTRPRPEVVRELVAQHRAAQAAQVTGFSWGGGWGWGYR